jgi:hypothetical protein
VTQGYGRLGVRMIQESASEAERNRETVGHGGGAGESAPLAVLPLTEDGGGADGAREAPVKGTSRLKAP